MASTLNPYLTFQGTAREAMEFYRDVFGGELTLTTFADFGLADIPNPEYIMHAQLDTTAGYTLMASDPAPGVTMTPGSAITGICVASAQGETAPELESVPSRCSPGVTYCGHQLRYTDADCANCDSMRGRMSLGADGLAVTTGGGLGVGGGSRVRDAEHPAQASAARATANRTFMVNRPPS